MLFGKRFLSTSNSFFIIIKNVLILKLYVLHVFIIVIFLKRGEKGPPFMQSGPYKAHSLPRPRACQDDKFTVIDFVI
jgi:hypothetical protein